MLSVKTVIAEWLIRISHRDPSLGGHKICPFARMPRIVEVTKLSQEVFDIKDNQLTIYMETSVASSYEQIESLCRILKQQHSEYVFLPDHPSRVNFIKDKITGNGYLPCIIVQTKKELESARLALAKTDYYTFWDLEYLEEIRSFD